MPTTPRPARGTKGAWQRDAFDSIQRSCRGFDHFAPQHQPAWHHVSVARDTKPDDWRVYVERRGRVQQGYRTAFKLAGIGAFQNLRTPLSQVFGQPQEAESLWWSDSRALRWIAGPWDDRGSQLASLLSCLAEASYEADVRGHSERRIERPAGIDKPVRQQSNGTRRFERDPRVKAWVIQEAGGRCEACKLPAPFTDRKGAGFLEVHHVRPLAVDGSDTVTNVVAVCPNCHRALHHAGDSPSRVRSLFRSISRLVKE